MKKAEKIFTDTYTACRIHIKDWDIEYNPDGSAVGFNNLITECAICTRTINDVQKLYDAECKKLAIAEKYDFGDSDYRIIKRKALLMVQSTINNARKTLIEYL